MFKDVNFNVLKLAGKWLKLQIALEICNFRYLPLSYKIFGKKRIHYDIKKFYCF